MPRRYTFTREQLNAFLQQFNAKKLYRHAFFDTAKTVVTPQIVRIGTNENVISIINPDGLPTFDPADVTTSVDVKAAFHDALSHNFKADVPRSVYDFIIQNTEFYEPGAAVGGAGGAGGAGGGNPTTGPGTSPNRSLWGTPSTPGSTTGDPTAAAAAPTAESDPYTFSSSPGRRNRKVRRTRRNRKNRKTRRYRTKQNRY